MEYIVACPDRERLDALCAFADHWNPRDPRGVRHVLPVLLATRLVALAGGAKGMAAVAAFTHDHQAWFRLWVPLGPATPSRDTYLRRVRRLDPETAMQACPVAARGDPPTRPAGTDPGPGRPGGVPLG